MSIDKIVNFEGKRNCSITLLLKVNDRYSSTLDQIERKISAIKHENKRKQLKNVIYRSRMHHLSNRLAEIEVLFISQMLVTVAITTFIQITCLKMIHLRLLSRWL